MRIKEKRGEGGLRKKGILLCFMSFFNKEYIVFLVKERNKII